MYRLDCKAKSLKTTIFYYENHKNQISIIDNPDILSASCYYKLPEKGFI
jgi:hypothetical protein